MAAAFVLPKAPLDLGVAHRSPIEFKIVDAAANPDLGVGADLAVCHMRAAQDLADIEPQAQLGQLHLVQQLVALRRDAAVDVFRPPELAADRTDEPDAFLRREAAQPPKSLGAAREPPERD